MNDENNWFWTGMKVQLLEVQKKKIRLRIIAQRRNHLLSTQTAVWYFKQASNNNNPSLHHIVFPLHSAANI